ncbi:hypothetical protein [Actinocrispum sp. NPDC049592]|uniref:hypothetical protein n=1 Tax=Actinocrispum sp. NPDC049592 TaxID=3154835 RepID=UPI003422906D
MPRYYTQAELDAAVRRQAEMDRRYYGDIQNAIQARSRSWLYRIVRSAVGVIFGDIVGEVVGRGVDAVWNFFSNLFSR